MKQYDQQIALLKSVKYWYLLPPYVGLTVMTAGLWMDRASRGPLGVPDFLWPVIYTVVFATVWWLNEGVGVGRGGTWRVDLLSPLRLVAKVLFYFLPDR